MKTIINTLRYTVECLLVLTLLPVIGLMWVAWATTNEPPGDAPQPARLPPPAPRPLPAVQPLPRYIKREWRRRRHRMLTRLLGHGDFVTEWQLR